MPGVRAGAHGALIAAALLSAFFSAFLSRQDALASDSPCAGRIAGRVIDAATRSGLGRTTVRITALDRVCLTDSLGAFSFLQICPGSYALEIRRVTHLPLTRRVTVAAAPGVAGGATAGEGAVRTVGDTASIVVALTPRTILMEEVKVRATEVVPLTSVIRPARTVPANIVDDFGGSGLERALELLPGVTVSGDRPYFRGAAPEQVQPLIDGVPAREPISGQWLLPPPQSVSSAEYLSGAMTADAGSALGGVMAFHLAEGGPRSRGRITYGSDRTGLAMRRSWNTDILGLSVSGPAPTRGLFYSGAWQARATDTYLSYDRALPGQVWFGALGVGSRGSGSEAGSAKLTWRPDGAAWAANAAVVTTRERSKEYHGHYSRSGDVGFYSAYDTYTTFTPGSSGADSVVFYEGPSAVPALLTRSTIGYLKLTRRLGEPSSVSAYASYGHFAQDQHLHGADIHDDAGLLDWMRRDLTSTAHQVEPYYAVQGDTPEFSHARSDVYGGGVSGSIRAADAHDVRFGGGLQSGRHGYVSIAPPLLVGSFEGKMAVIDAYGFIEDTWYSDRLSWMQLALRCTARRVRDHGATYTGSRWTPALAFHQPMSPTDALHLQIGTTCQFPALQAYFRPRLGSGGSTGGLDLRAESATFAELGVQHHVSPRAVSYLGVYRREYSDLVFTRRTPSELEELRNGLEATPPRSLATQGCELIFDFQPHPSLVGQSSMVWAKSVDQDDLEVPWSRQFYLRSWLAWSFSRSASATVSAHWNNGRPYAICIKPRDCSEGQLLRGRLPSQYGVDLALRVSRPLHGAVVALRMEAYNVLDRRSPTYDFSVYPMGVSSNNFLAYYHQFRRTDGYVLDYNYSGTGFVQTADNPETRSPGRSLLIGAEVGF